MRKNNKTITMIVAQIFLSLFLLLVAPIQSQTDDNIVEVAVSLVPEGFATLVDLVVLAELDDALANAETVTVLAPTDEAFAKLDPALVAALTTPPYKVHLQEILLYHTFDTLLKSSNLLNSRSVQSGCGLYLTTQNTDEDRVQFRTEDGSSLVLNKGAAKVVVADVMASNGVIHAIDNVLLPSFASKTVATRIEEDRRDLRTLYSLLQQAGLTEVLEGDGPFTVFAPIDEAFDGVDASTLDDETLQNILTYHVVPGMYPSFLIENGFQLTTVQGQNITFAIDMGMVTLNDGIPIESTDAVAINGIVHKIGGILMPEMK
jgi:transforming growth factor-beta-induced protein